MNGCIHEGMNPVICSTRIVCARRDMTGQLLLRREEKPRLFFLSASPFELGDSADWYIDAVGDHLHPLTGTLAQARSR